MSIKVSLPIVLLFRSMVLFALYTIKDPDTWFFYLVIPILHVTYFASILVCVSYIAKMFPKDIRGMLNSVIGVAGAISGWLYLIYCDYLFKKSARLPFLGISLSDIAITLLVIILVSSGQFGTIIKP